MSITIGVLAFHGDVIEHIHASTQAARNAHIDLSVVEVRTKTSLCNIQGLIIPGGESTTLHKLCEREDMWETMKTVPYLFGTCAGAIMMAKSIHHKAEGQKSLERMNITIDRNAYGRQSDSFEEKLITSLGTIPALYIRAPKIESISNNVNIIAERNSEILACEETNGTFYNLAATFHPELTTTLFHEYFLKKITEHYSPKF